MPLVYWLIIHFKKVLISLLWEMKKAVTTFIVFFFLFLWKLSLIGMLTNALKALVCMTLQCSQEEYGAKMIKVLACFNSERHLLFIQEPCMTKIYHSYVGVAIYTQSADTRPGSIKNRVGFGFKKKKPEMGPGRVRVLIKTRPRPD